MTSKRETRTLQSMRRETDKPMRRGKEMREGRRTGTRGAIVRNAMREES